MSSPLSPYLPLAIAMLVAGVLGTLIVGVASILGPKRPSRIKSEPFECGSEPIGSARQRFAVKFFVVEAVFLYPWAVNFKELGWFGYWEMALFAATLVVALIYIFKKGALNWEN